MAPHLCDSRMDSLCANALHSDVLPVPGGPCSSTTLQHSIAQVTHHAQHKHKPQPCSGLVGTASLACWAGLVAYALACRCVPDPLHKCCTVSPTLHVMLGCSQR